MHFVSFVTKLFAICKVYDLGLPQIRTPLFDPNHTHTNPQILYVIQGTGIVATEEEEIRVTPGTLILIPPGENHWHGATKDSAFSHISITTPGKTAS